MKLFQIILLLSVAALTGCTDFFNQVVDIEIPEHEPSLAVSAHFRAQDTALIVFVSRSAGILDSVILDSVSIQGAAVAVLRDGSLLADRAERRAGAFLPRDGRTHRRPTTYLHPAGFGARL
ncbi:MAG: hypothetical protein IPJ00_16590 [Saprospirales bacterium]|nr:hypothetical protein [Saprospirales bacterium]